MSASNGTYFLNLGRIKGPQGVLYAARHNLREIVSEIGEGGSIDASRIADNVLMHGPSEAVHVANLAKSLMRAGGAGPLRKDAVRGIESLVSLRATAAIDVAAFFDAALAFMNEWLGVPLLSAIAHHDESEPHFHALYLPLMRDGSMNGSELIGPASKGRDLQAAFHRDVAAAFGLSYTPSRTPLAGVDRTRAVEQVFACIFPDPESAPAGAKRTAVLRAIGGNLKSLAKAYGVDLRTFAEIMTKPQKPEKSANDRFSVHA